MRRHSPDTAMKRVVSVSIPRSGHHLLVQLLWNYFKFGRFLYCEAYTTEGCCGRIPCTAVSERAKVELGTDLHLRLFMQKSHDLNNEVAPDPNARYLVQIRDPAQAAIGYLRWEMTHGWKENFSLGEIPKSLFDFLCYYIRFYHKWCAPIVEHGKPDRHVIYYEQLIGSQAQARSEVLGMLEWLNLPIDDEAMDYSLNKSLGVDAHSREARSLEDRRYDVDYYDRFCGGSFRFLLGLVAAFCPGSPVSCGGSGGRAGTEEERRRMREVFFPMDLSATSEAILDFKSTERRLQQQTLTVSGGAPVVYRALGLSYGDPGSGVWTVSESAIFPFRISSEAQNLGGEVVAAVPGTDLDLSRGLNLSAVLQGQFVPVNTSFSTQDGRTVLRFDFSAPNSANIDGRDCALVLKTARPPGLANASKGLSVLLDRLSLSRRSA